MPLKMPRSSLSPVVFVGLFALIAATAGQGIPGGDAGELAVAACTRSVAHAPGYPLWTLLSKVALLLPFGTPAWRLALASAAATAGAAALLVAILRWAGVNRAAAVFGAAVFVCAAPVWQFATTPEVFALNSLLVAAGLYAAQRMWPLLVGLALGLGLANHLTCLALLGPVALYFMIAKRSPLVVLGAALGLLPYLYLPWASAAGSPYSWGDQTTLAGFIAHVLRRDYGTFQLMQSGGNVSPYVDKLLLYMRSEIVPLAVGLIGAVVVARRRPPHTLLLTIAFASALAYVLMFHAAANVSLDIATHREVLSRFWIMPALVLGLFGGFAADWLPSRLIPVALTFALLLLGARANDRRAESLVARYARAALTTMPPNTLVLVRGDLSFPLVYLQACERQRPDVWILNRPFLEFPWSRSRYLAAHSGLELPEGLYDPIPTGFPGTYALTDLMQLNIDRRPILLQYFDAMLVEYKQVAQWAGRFDILPIGFLMQAFRTSPRDWPAYAAASRGALDLYAGAEARGDAWDDLVQQEYVDAEFLRGAYLAVAAHADPQVIPIALRALDEAKNVPGQRLDRIFKVRGWALAVAAQTDPGARAEALANWREYLRLAPPTDEERARIAATVAKLESLKP